MKSCFFVKFYGGSVIGGNMQIQSGIFRQALHHRFHQPCSQALSAKVRGNFHMVEIKSCVSMFEHTAMTDRICRSGRRVCAGKNDELPSFFTVFTDFFTGERESIGSRRKRQRSQRFFLAYPAFHLIFCAPEIHLQERKSSKGIRALVIQKKDKFGVGRFRYCEHERDRPGRAVKA